MSKQIAIVNSVGKNESSEVGGGVSTYYEEIMSYYKFWSTSEPFYEM